VVEISTSGIWNYLRDVSPFALRAEIEAQICKEANENEFEESANCRYETQVSQFQSPLAL